jgi:hypothetical protein
VNLAIRLKNFIDTVYGGIPVYVRDFNFNESQVYRLCKGAAAPSTETLDRLAKTGINVHWLVCGEGTPFAPNEAGKAIEMAYKKKRYEQRLDWR